MSMKHYFLGLTALELSFIGIILLGALFIPSWMLLNDWVIAVLAVSTFFISSFHRIEDDALARAKRNSEDGLLAQCEGCGEPVQPGDSLCFHCKLEASFLVYPKK